MKTRARVLGVIASIGALAVGWELGTAGETVTATTATPGASSATTTTTDGSGSTSTGLDATSTSTSTPTATAASGTSGSSAAKDGTFTGAVESTRFGNVQVSVTIANGAITDVTALALTDREQRSVQISAYAAPLLKAEVIQAQSANVSTIGGATYTSDGYLSSLQAALDDAGFTS